MFIEVAVRSGDCLHSIGLLSVGLEVLDDLGDVGVHKVEGVLDGGADVVLHDVHDDVVEDARERADHRVHQPVGQDVAGQAHAQTAGKCKGR